MKFNKKRITNLLVLFSLIFLWSVSGLVIGRLMAKIFSPKIEYINSSENFNDRIESNSILKIFGTDKVDNLSEKDVRIIGLVAGSKNGAILISINKGPVRTLKVGEISDDGWIFKGVSNDTVVLFYKGQTINVPFSGNKSNIFDNKPKKIKKRNNTDNLI